MRTIKAVGRFRYPLVDDSKCRLTGVFQGHGHSLFVQRRKGTQHPIRQVVIRVGLGANADFHPGEVLAAQLLDDGFDAVVASGRTLCPNPQPSGSQGDIVKQDDDPLGRNFEEGGQLHHGLASLSGSLFFKKLMGTVLILVIGVLIIRVIMRIITAALEKSHLEKAAHSLIFSLARAAMYILLFLIAASQMGIDVSSIVALASVLTLALSLALQNMVSNLIGGFVILYTHPFHSGDYVEIAGQGGTVKEISMTYTVLATPDNRIISIPNSAVAAAQVVNYSSADSRRVELTVTASYDAPTQKVLDALVLAGTVDNALLNPAPSAVIISYDDSAIRYSLRIWVKPGDYWDVYFQVNQRIKDVFDQQGIEMTYPHLNVHLDK